MRCAQQCIRLGLVDHAAADRLHVDCDARNCSAVLVEGVGEACKVIAMIGQELQVREQAACFLERLLLTATWVIKCLVSYTLYLPSIVVVLPHPAAVIGVEVGQSLPPRL